LHHDTEDQSLVSSLMHPPRKLTNLEKLLAAVSIILLILMSTFIGLFASTEKRLNHETGRHGGGGGGHGGVSTSTAWATKTTTVSSAPTGKPEPVSSEDHIRRRPS
jgi:endothelin-converting enzyme